MERPPNDPITEIRNVGRALIAALCLGIGAAGAAGGIVPDYGFQWATITHAGNRAANAVEAPFLDGAPAPGRVNYEYRIATTEVTVGQWFDFVQAYAPYYEGSPGDIGFTSLGIAPVGPGPGGTWTYSMASGMANRPATMSWRYAARYVNWLCNGQRTDRAAFESGAYDTSTFTVNPDGTYNDQADHSPGAAFWVPSVDEWTKAVYFDPDRYGPGQPGYWMQPLGSDAQAISGPPGEGQTSGGVRGPSFLRTDVGSYPDALTPWGLLDASGGVQEWTQTISTGAPQLFLRYARGSLARDSTYFNADRIDEYWLYHEFVLTGGAGTGLRIAGIVPSPSALVWLATTWVIVRARRSTRREWGT